MDRTLVIAWLSLLVSLVVLAAKVAAWMLTGSVALYSDALETLINVAAAATALFALWYSARPADENHPYGHHKAEYFSAVIEGAMVLATAFMIADAAVSAWRHPVLPRTPFLGVAINVGAGALNLIWSLVLRREARRTRSPALAAGSAHLMADVWTTLAVVAGFALVPLTGLPWIDAAIAGLVALNILRGGYGVLRESVGGLMDEVTDLDEVAKVRAAIARGGRGAIEAHDIRMREAGRMTFVDFHLVVPGTLQVDAAHAICDRIEQSIREVVGESVISIHVEPPHKSKADHPPRRGMERDVVLLG